jgi:hypothetical protein
MDVVTTDLLVKPLVRPAPEVRSRVVGTPLVPTPPGGCGAQRRARAAPLGAGTGATRSHAQPPLGGEHDEHGEDPPLARSEHRGTRLGSLKAPKVVHSVKFNFVKFLVSGLKSAFRISSLLVRSEPNGWSIRTKRVVYPNQTGGLSEPNGWLSIVAK